ncbi:MAG: dTDP-4-dehydrorhamnose 3,5-epimerase family protein [Deltaproteobacteria bacterium]|nr:dTDP-4-dehydrorhamnose 3,5-epimerase family protein [Deltaproteobacteria bacterium]
MKFLETPLKDVCIVEIEPIEDSRGLFARSWCKREFESHSLNPELVQCNISFNIKKGILRGMHYQIKPFEEAKLVRCTRGAIFDVIIDLRADSPTFKDWFAVELTEVFYQMSEYYSPEHSRGIRWNDPSFSIQWPEDKRIISKRDQQYPDFSQ